MSKAALILTVLALAGCASLGKQANTARAAAVPVAIDPADRADMAAAQAEFILAAERFEESDQHALLSVIDLARNGGVDAQKVQPPLGRWQEALGMFHAALERYKGSRSQADATEVLRLIGVQQAIMEQIKNAITEAKAELEG
jgi:hypothetical protein